MTDRDKRRRIRSYVLRAGRMTPGQQRAIDQNWERWGLDHADGLLDLMPLLAAPGPVCWRSALAWASPW